MGSRGTAHFCHSSAETSSGERKWQAQVSAEDFKAVQEASHYQEEIGWKSMPSAYVIWSIIDNELSLNDPNSISSKQTQVSPLEYIGVNSS